MATRLHDVDQRMKRFEEALRNSGIKLTHQRLEIFREMAMATDHPDAETVFHDVRKRVPTVSLDTVYRTLWLLNDLGLITTLGSPKGRTRFDANLIPHHHFVCVRCGLTRDFDSAELDALRLPDTLKDFGHVETARVEARGVCVMCFAKGEKTNFQEKRRKSHG